MFFTNKSLCRKIYIFLLISLFLIPAVGYFTKESKALGAVYATVETTPVSHSGDSADDMAIWIHPTDPSLSTIIGTDKNGNLEVYDLSGAVLQTIPFLTNNVDLRYNFPLGGQSVALVTGVDKSVHKLFAYKVNPATRLLEDVSTPSSFPGLLGSSMYVSPITGKYYAFTNHDSVLKQYELVDDGSGKVAVNLVRTVTFGSFINLTEGVTADDVHAKVYVSEEAVAIWKLGAEPTDGDTKVMVDKPIAQGGHFQPDIEGLAIYYKTDGTGYLIGSSQGDSTFTVYTREGNNDYVGTFNITDGVIDGVNKTDGIDVTNFPLGPNFPYGVFIAQDGINNDGNTALNQNFKLVPFESIAGALNLTMDTSWDPRLVGLNLPPSLTPVEVNIGESNVGNYNIPFQSSERDSYAGVDNGPVEVVSTNTAPIVVGLRELFSINGMATSSYQFLGLPSSELSDTYWFPSYNNVTLNEQLRFGNVDVVDTNVTVTIGTSTFGPYLLHPNEQMRINYPGVDNGPVKVQSSGGAKITAAIRDAWFAGGAIESFSQLMGLPDSQLSDTYWFPSYNNITLNEQLRLGNVGNADTNVTVTIGTTSFGPYLLHPNEQMRINYPGVDSGPVKVQGSDPNVPIIAALREAWSQNGTVQSWIQMMGLPEPQLSDTYYFPAYDNVSLNGQLRFGNVGNADTNVTVTIGTTSFGPYLLHPSEQLRVNYPGVDSGPIKVQSSGGVKIIAALRDALSVYGVVESFAQMIGLPGTQISDTYLFPAYNNVSLDEQLRIGVP